MFHIVTMVTVIVSFG